MVKDPKHAFLSPPFSAIRCNSGTWKVFSLFVSAVCAVRFAFDVKLPRCFPALQSTPSKDLCDDASHLELKAQFFYASVRLLSADVERFHRCFCLPLSGLRLGAAEATAGDRGGRGSTAAEPAAFTGRSSADFFFFLAGGASAFVVRCFVAVTGVGPVRWKMATKKPVVRWMAGSVRTQAAPKHCTAS